MTPRAHHEPSHRSTASPPEGLALDIRCCSYEERRAALPSLLEAMGHCGGWVLERQVLPSGRVEFWFEAPLRAAMEIYSAIIGAGLEPNRAGHRDIAALCTLRKNLYQPAGRSRMVTLRLEISFLDEDENSFPVASSRAARA